MFELPLWQLSITARTGPGQWLAEAVATFGLPLTIFGCIARTPAAVPYAVGLYITAAYWCPSGIRHVGGAKLNLAPSVERTARRKLFAGVVAARPL